MIRCICNLVISIKWGYRLLFTKKNISNNTDSKPINNKYNTNSKTDSMIIDIDDGYGWYYFLE